MYKGVHTKTTVNYAAKQYLLMLSSSQKVCFCNVLRYRYFAFHFRTLYNVTTRVR